MADEQKRGLLEKFKDTVSEVTSAATEVGAAMISDEVLAGQIVKASNKVKGMNDALKQKGCEFTIASFDLTVGLSVPTVTFHLEPRQSTNS